MAQYPHQPDFNPYAAPEADVGPPPAHGDPYRKAPVEYAGFWRRALALLIDGLILNVFGFVVGLVIGVVFVVEGGNPRDSKDLDAALRLLMLVMGWLYAALMESSGSQATLGKMAIGLKVTDLYGGRISFARATGRYFGKLVSGLVLGFGFFMAGFTERKQALHDKMANTLVLKAR